MDLKLLLVQCWTLDLEYALNRHNYGNSQDARPPGSFSFLITSNTAWTRSAKRLSLSKEQALRNPAVMWGKNKTPTWEWFIPVIYGDDWGMAYDCFTHITSWFSHFSECLFRSKAQKPDNSKVLVPGNRPYVGPKLVSSSWSKFDRLGPNWNCIASGDSP